MTTIRQAKALARRIEVALRAHADPVRARGAKAYLKSDWEFIGIAAPAVPAGDQGGACGQPAARSGMP